MVYSSGYPVYHGFSNPGSGSMVVYDVLKDGVSIYTGRIVTFDDSATVRVDIGPVVRGYLGVGYELFAFGLDGTASAVSDALGHFTVRSGGVDTAYDVLYDYNTDYRWLYREDDAQSVSEAGELSFPLSFEVDRRQMLFSTGYSVSGDGLVFVCGVDDGLRVSVASASVPYIFGVRLRDRVVPDQFYFGEQQYGSVLSYRAVSGCGNRFAVYYVNKRGGLDSLLCTGKSVESWSANRVDVQLYGDRRNRLDWSQKRIDQEMRHRWQLHTGFIRPEYLGRIDHLIYSPKVFLHDLDRDTITSVLVTEGDYQVKNRKNGDKPFYAFTVEESQKQIRQ